jgi:hypothetical protein
MAQMLLKLTLTVSMVLAGLLSAADTASMQGAETFTATASAKGSAGTKTSPVTITIARLTTDAERATVAEALKRGGTAAVRETLAKMPDVGTLDVGQRKNPLKYAYQRTVGSGRIITLITDTPIAYLGEGGPDAKPKAGYDLGLVLLDLSNPGKGSGELAPAARVKLNEAGAVVTEDYGAEVVRLTDVQKK